MEVGVINFFLQFFLQVRSNHPKSPFHEKNVGNLCATKRGYGGGYGLSLLLRAGTVRGYEAGLGVRRGLLGTSVGLLGSTMQLAYMRAASYPSTTLQPPLSASRCNSPMQPVIPSAVNPLPYGWV